MDDREGSFVAVRGISQGLERGTEECLQNRIDVAYDTTIPLHQEALWKLSFPEEELHGLISEAQVSFRGGGFISLENLLYFARNFQKSFQDLLRKQVGERSVWEYPFAVAVKPRTVTFLKFLSENESAFDILYCIAFKLMDQQWLSMHIHGIQHGDEINKETAGERADAGRYNAS